MATPRTSLHPCSICLKDVPLKKSKTDEHGNAVHQECYVIKTEDPKILSGWKDIANYLQKGVRTVQRYERELSLPVRRPAKKAKGSVIAAKADLDRWVSGSPARVYPMSDLTPTAQRSNKLKADFLQIDSQVALTFSGIALAASDPGRKEHTTLTARHAYNTIMRLRQDVFLNDVERNKLDINVARLKSELQRLGQSF